MNKLKVISVGGRGFPKVQGGVEKHCERISVELAKLGCDVTMITRTPYIPVKSRVSRWDGVKFIHLWAIKQKYIEAILHTFIGIIIARFKSPDILHIHAIGPSLLVPFAKILGLKVVMTHHGPDYERKKWGGFAKMVLKLGEYSGVKYADKVIAISEKIKLNLASRYKREDIEYIPNGISIIDFTENGEILKKYNLSRKNYIFTACRFVPEKGLHDLIAAYKEIKNPAYKLVIAGDADHETEYSRNLKKMACENGVILTGFVYGEVLQALYSSAGLFVLPSYYEGLPIVLLEAISYGLPVLVSDIPQNKEIPISDFRFFTVGNVKVLTRKIEELFKKGISKEEKNSQRSLLFKKYSWEKIALKTKKVYEKLV